MLSREDNELLTRVGPGTGMGSLLRCFWQPFGLASELPGADSDPVRVRLLGEDLVAFRDSNGTPGLLAANCSHRGALLFGRDEPAESGFEHRVKATAYPVEERGGVLWAYLGPRAEVPSPPELEWTHVPATHRYVSKRIQACNYLQNVEGEVDSSHVSFLHSKGAAPDAAGIQDLRSTLPDYMARDRAPRFFVLPTEYGMLIGARRNADEDSYYWRVTQFLMPTS